MYVSSRKLSKTEARQKHHAPELCLHYVILETSHTCSYDCGNEETGFCGCNGVYGHESYYCEKSVDHDGEHSTAVSMVPSKVTLNWDE